MKRCASALRLVFGLLLSSRGLAQPIQCSIATTDTNTVFTSWNAMAGRHYHVQASATATGIWSNAFSLPETLTAISNGLGCCLPASSGSRFFRIAELSVSNVPPGMVWIPAGSFVMGDSFSEGHYYERPLHRVYVSAFYLDRQEVTEALWDEVYRWGFRNGYSIGGGWGKGTNYPIHDLDWYDAVKWCNARSQKENRTPVYYTNAALTEVYKKDLAVVYAKWDASGYRLPTEAEWEKAARGGASGRRFSWPEEDTIMHSRANYKAVDGFYYPYDLSSPAGYHPTFAVGDPYDYTSSVGYFAPNSYGLYDMTGNVGEWCWDVYVFEPYPSDLQTDPRGLESGAFRVVRGGAWRLSSYLGRVANRGTESPTMKDHDIGFRTVLPAVQ
jgi:formylglycine-generating enzyme